MTRDARILPDAPAIEDRILMFLQRELLGPGVAVDRQINLLSGELLDSMSVLRLATFVGETFQIHIHAADFVIENFRNIDAIGAYVRRRLADSPG
jgi:acyl carrier protein